MGTSLLFVFLWLIFFVLVYCMLVREIYQLCGDCTSPVSLWKCWMWCVFTHLSPVHHCRLRGETGLLWGREYGRQWEAVTTISLLTSNTLQSLYIPALRSLSLLCQSCSSFNWFNLIGQIICFWLVTLTTNMHLIPLTAVCGFNAMGLDLYQK